MNIGGQDPTGAIPRPAQLELARELDGDAGQGFLLAAPAPADETATWLRFPNALTEQ